MVAFRVLSLKGDFDMFESGRYNGWTNHETWLVNLWITNSQSGYQTLCEAMELADSVARAEWLEEQIRTAYMEIGSHIGACMWSDLLTLSIGRVNWLEIVENQD